jgi:hypothetical protein
MSLLSKARRWARKNVTRRNIERAGKALGRQLWKDAKEAVNKAEASGKNGKEKYKDAWERLRANYWNEELIDLGINWAVQLLDKQINILLDEAA